MKKSIQKPENWQDFETLCKKLWGEIFEIPHEIKKNGRSGQIQNGVDVYGIPKGEDKYIGIQCKGKDNYTNVKLTELEIDTEIEKAKNFKPLLGTLIFATTANKDSKIEGYIRLRNEKSEFKILIFCWEDIADLIEENKNTYDWYVKNLMHKTKYNFRILFNDFQELLVLNPKFSKKITKFVYKEKSPQQIIAETEKYISEVQLFLRDINKIKLPTPNFNSDTVNKSWVTFTIILENSGSVVLENWSFNLKFINGVDRIDDESLGYPMSNISLINLNNNDPRHIDNDEKLISYNPIRKTVLVQKDNVSFDISILVEKEAKEVILDWELIARDFDMTGTQKILIEPIYTVSIKEEEAISLEEEKEETEIDYYRGKK